MFVAETPSCTPGFFLSRIPLLELGHAYPFALRTDDAGSPIAHIKQAQITLRYAAGEMSQGFAGFNQSKLIV